MPEEVAIIVVVAIIAGAVTSIVKHVTTVKADARTRGTAAEGSSLTTTELKRLVMEAVQEANEDLALRLEALEALLHEKQAAERPRLPERSAGVVEAVDEALEADKPPAERARV